MSESLEITVTDLDSDIRDRLRQAFVKEGFDPAIRDYSNFHVMPSGTVPTSWRFLGLHD
jgi:hypothetical protein